MAPGQDVTREELLRALAAYLRSRGLVPVKLLVFDLPTEYRHASVDWREDAGRPQEVRTFDIDGGRIAEYRTLRKRFYRLLHTCAYRTLMGWALMEGRDLSALDEVIARLNDLSGSGRAIHVVQVFVPRDWLVQQLSTYIKERRMCLEKLRERARELAESDRRLRHVRRQAYEVMEQIASLERELERLEREPLEARIERLLKAEGEAP